ncbi:MAG TPA: FtsQ-type POTRA domain-containing protein [Micromonosporaceae bacterium]|nr:FtsQ-type POTRA domain-containing protein [Micromonosporaceae bacterium]
MSGRRWQLVRARPDAVPSSVRRFTQRARRRRLRAALPWAIGAAVLALGGLVAWLVYGTPLLGVDDVRVTGTDLVSAEEVLAAADVRPGTPLARVDLADVQRRVARLAPVDRVTASRDWPGTLLVEVQERIAVAAVPSGERFVLVDAAGVGYTTVPARPAHLPVVRLADPGPDDPATRAAMQVLAALTDDLDVQLTELVVEAPARIRLKLRKGREVIWGDATENEAKAKVATVLLGRDGRTIDVSAPEVVTIK